MGCTFSPSDRVHGEVVRMARVAEVENPEALESPMGDEGGSRDHSGPNENHGHVEGGDVGEDWDGDDGDGGDEGDDLVDCRPGMRK